MNIQLSSQALKDLDYFSKKIVNKNLVVGPGGNISIREDEMVWISPSGYSLDDIEPDGWVPVRLQDSTPIHPYLRPSSELAMHLDIYRARPDVQAIVHTHPPVSIGITSTEEYSTIPAMFPDYVALVGEVPYIDYVVPCSQELADAVTAVLQNPAYSSLLLKNHGLITLGTNLKQAYYRTEIIEDAARVFWVSRSVGTPKTLSKSDIEQILSLEAEKYRQKLLDRS